MPFTSKAQEIHDHIVSNGQSDYWIGVAKKLIKHQRKAYTRDVPILRDQLIAELSSAVEGANDNHWEEIAHWLFYEAKCS